MAVTQIVVLMLPLTSSLAQNDIAAKETGNSRRVSLRENVGIYDIESEVLTFPLSQYKEVGNDWDILVSYVSIFDIDVTSSLYRLAAKSYAFTNGEEIEWSSMDEFELRSYGAEAIEKLRASTLDASSIPFLSFKGVPVSTAMHPLDSNSSAYGFTLNYSIPLSLGRGRSGGLKSLGRVEFGGRTSTITANGEVDMYFEVLDESVARKLADNDSSKNLSVYYFIYRHSTHSPYENGDPVSVNVYALITALELLDENGDAIAIYRPPLETKRGEVFRIDEAVYRSVVSQAE